MTLIEHNNLRHFFIDTFKPYFNLFELHAEKKVF